MAGRIVSPVPLVEESAKKMVVPIGSDVRPAGWLASQPFMMERLETMPILEDANIRLPSGWKVRRVHCGNTACWSIKE